jgi:hypothetical protein
MITFKDFYSELYEAENEKRLLLEFECYQLIPGTNNSYREDRMNTSSKALKNAHVYARQKGVGRKLYAVNYDGSGHDGSSGMQIPSSHAEYFRSKGYNIAKSNILECINVNELDGSTHQILCG